MKHNGFAAIVPPGDGLRPTRLRQPGRTHPCSTVWIHVRSPARGFPMRGEANPPRLAMSGVC
jgi:hypothetical protein